MAVDHASKQGAANVIESCLAVQPGERFALMCWRPGDCVALLAQAATDAGAKVTRLDLESLLGGPELTPARATTLSRALQGHTVSISVGDLTAPIPLFTRMVTLTREAGLRHLHLPSNDVRLLGQSMRADPTRLAALNERVCRLLQPPTKLTATSDAGTEFEAQLSTAFKLVSCDGRPPQGEADNLPSGFVYTHPSTASGTLVIDRTISRMDGALIRRNPLTFTIESGRVTRVSSRDATLQAEVEKYLASHPEAPRVGMVSLSTNYMVRSEIGVEVQDSLLPGLKVYLGYADPTSTGAKYTAEVQLRMRAHRMTVEAGRKRIVTAGRFEDELVEGIDPFR